MQNCRFFAQYYVPYLLNELEASDQYSFEEHLFNCSVCQEQINKLAKLDKFMIKNFMYDLAKKLPYKSEIEEKTQEHMLAAAEDVLIEPDLFGPFPSIDFRYSIEVLYTASRQARIFLKVPSGETAANRRIRFLSSEEQTYITDNNGSFFMEIDVKSPITFMVD